MYIGVNSLRECGRPRHEPYPCQGVRNTGRTLLRVALALGLIGPVAGCPKPPGPPILLGPLPRNQAVALVNANSARLISGLKAKGTARGQIVLSGGEKRSFDFSGTLLLIPPRHLRFDLQNGLGQTEVLFGSNEDLFWLHVQRDDDTLRYGRYDTPEEERALKPALRADWLIEALGLNLVPLSAAALSNSGIQGPVQLIEEDRQRLLFISQGADGLGVVQKEYVLSRYAPRLIESIVYRDEDGGVKMRSRLEAYRSVSPEGPQLPHRIRVDWPAHDAWLEYSVSRWEEREELTPDHAAFELQTPRKLKEKYRHVIDIDTGRE